MSEVSYVTGDVNIYYSGVNATDASGGSTVIPGIPDEEAAAALANNFIGQLDEGVNGLVESLDLDPEQEAAIREAIGEITSDGRQEVSPEAQAAVDALFSDENGQVVRDLMDVLMTLFKEMEEDERTAEASSTDPEGGRLSAEGGSNWFVILTRALAEIQSKWLSMLQAAYQDMQENVGDSEEEQSAFIQAQAEVQAYAKLFGMASETTSTVIKTLGDGLTSIARKQ